MEIQTKRCSKCGEEKPITEFNKMKNGKYGVNSRCKLCARQASLDYYNDPVTGPKKATTTARWREANIEKVKQDEKKWRENNKEYLNHKSKEWCDNHKEYLKEYRKLNADKAYESTQAFLQRNPGYAAKRFKERYNNEPEFRLRTILKVTIIQALKQNKKNKSIEFLGCSIEEWKQHLESQFLPEMNWSNHGEIWEIDHIIPLTKQGSFHYSNTQPLFKTTKIAESFGYNDQIGNKNKKNNIL